MNLSARTSIGIAATAAAAVTFVALGVRIELHRHLDVFASHFAMMQRMMGWGPDLQRIYFVIDRALLGGLAIAVALSILVAIGLGRSISRSVEDVDRGLERFARGEFGAPIAPSGPSELRRIAGRANDMARQIEEARAAERSLVAGLTHDLAHPLTAIRSTLEATRDGVADPIRADIAQRLLESVGTLDLTLGDLRDVAASDAGYLRLNMSEVDVSVLVQRLGEVYLDYAARRGVDLSFEVTPALKVNSDEHRLKRVVANLAVNAIQATSAGGHVTLSATTGADSVCIAVVDEAGENATARLRGALLEGHDAGVGIRVVRTVAAALGASVSVDSTLRGSSVLLRVPRHGV